jgi:hypothetical protein
VMFVKMKPLAGTRPILGAGVAVALVVAGLLTGCAGSGTQGGPPSTLAPLDTGIGVTDSTVANAPTTTPTLPVISLEPVPLSGLVLSANSLGEAQFGDEPEATIAYISSLLGSPTADTGWLDPESEMLVCERDSFRQVEWGVLRVEFGSPSIYGPADAHFIGWDYGTDGRLGEDPEGIITGLGVGLGARIDELLAAYPTTELFEGEEGNFPPSFTEAGGLSGFTTGTTDSDVITVLQAGDRCGG